MKEIIIQNQEQFDSLPERCEEDTKIIISGELREITREINNSIIIVSDSAKIDYVYDSAKIDYVYDSAKIDYVYDSAKIDYVYDSAKIGSVYDSAKIGSVCGSAKIGSVYDSAKIGSVCSSAKIGSVYDSTKIGYVCGSAKIDCVSDSAQIGSVCGSAKIDCVSDSAKIDYVYDSAQIGSVCGSAKIDYVYDSAKIGSVYDSAKIDYVSDSAQIGSVCGSAKIDCVSDSAKIGSVSDSAKIGSVYGFGSVNLHNESSILLFGFSVVWLFNNKANVVKKSKTATIIEVNYESTLQQFEANNPIDLSKNNVILYKRVSNEFKTQEGKKNETIWTPGVKMNHHNWSPENSECGEGKYHACSLPVFCDKFRNKEDDKYIAIQVNKKDLFAWLNPQYPHKIAFKAGKVLYECDREGNKIVK